MSKVLALCGVSVACLAGAGTLLVLSATGKDQFPDASAGRPNDSSDASRTAPRQVALPRLEAAEQLPAGSIRYVNLSNQPAGWDSVESEEYMARLRAEFDLDGDGQLSKEERELMWDRVKADYRAERLARFDVNGDGVLDDEEERAARLSELLSSDWGQRQAKRFDTNNDGVLSKEEIAAMEASFEAMKDDFVAQHDLDGDRELDDLESEIMQASMQEQWQNFQSAVTPKFDADGNGKLDPQEWADVRTSMMASLQQRSFVKSNDANNDGIVDATDLPNFMSRFANNDPTADLNGDGVHNSADLDEFNRRIDEGENTMPSEEDLPIPDAWADQFEKAGG